MDVIVLDLTRIHANCDAFSRRTLANVNRQSLDAMITNALAIEAQDARAAGAP